MTGKSIKPTYELAHLTVELGESHFGEIRSTNVLSGLLTSYVRILSSCSDSVLLVGLATLTETTDITRYVPYHCVVMDCKPIAGFGNNDKLIILEKERNGKTLYHCCFPYSRDYENGVSCRFSPTNKVYKIAKIDGKDSYIIGDFTVIEQRPNGAPIQSQVRRTVSSAAIPVSPTKTSSAPDNVVRKDNVNRLHPGLQEAIDLFDPSRHSFVMFSVTSGTKRERKRITIPTPFAESDDYCRIDNCCNISCTRHTINEQIGTFQRIVDTDWPKSNFNCQLVGTAKVLLDAFIDWQDGKKIDWLKVMHQALLAVVPIGTAFEVASSN